MFQINRLFILTTGLILSLLLTIPANADEAINSCSESGCVQAESCSTAEIDLIETYKDLGLPDDLMKLITELATNPRPVTTDEHKMLYELGCSFNIVLRSDDGMTFEIDDYWQLAFHREQMESRVFSLEYWLTAPKAKRVEKEMPEELQRIVSEAGTVLSRYRDWQGNWVVMYDDRYAVYSESGELLREGTGHSSVLPYNIEIEGLRIVYV